MSVHVCSCVRQDWRGQFIPLPLADYKFEGGVILFIPISEVNLGLKVAMKQRKKWSNQPRGIDRTYGLCSQCACENVVSLSLVPIGTHAPL